MPNKTTHTPGLKAFVVCPMCKPDSEGLVRLCHLHAAAPELLSSAKCALHMLSAFTMAPGTQQRKWRDELRAAIAKAEGR